MVWMTGPGGAGAEAGRALPFAGWTLVVLPGPGSAVCRLLCLPCPCCESQDEAPEL